MLSNKVHFPKTRIYEISVPKFGTRKAVKMGLHSLLEKDLKEGKELMEIYSSIDR